MRTIVLSNEKGGVGKTTLSTHLAMMDAAMGHRVALIDADAQGHSTLRCGVKKSPGIFRLLVDWEEWNQHLVKVPESKFALPNKKAGELFVLPSNKNTRMIGQGIEGLDVLSRRLAELEAWGFEYVYIDTSPTPSLFHAVLYYAADEIIYPTELAFSSFDGLVESMQSKRGTDTARVNKYGKPQIEVVGIVPMKFRAQTLEHSENYESLRGQFGDKVTSPLNQSVIWQETERAGKAIWTYAPNSKAAAQFMDVYGELFGEVSNEQTA